jgi:hypothetical protein
VTHTQHGSRTRVRTYRDAIAGPNFSHSMWVKTANPPLEFSECRVEPHNNLRTQSRRLWLLAPRETAPSRRPAGGRFTYQSLPAYGSP